MVAFFALGFTAAMMQKAATSARVDFAPPRKKVCLASKNLCLTQLSIDEMARSYNSVGLTALSKKIFSLEFEIHHAFSMTESREAGYNW
mmetsp:Transcript_100/g.92  ORF Transcript_100/g.92 Transcript_100/m.92 type:complete len:89 (-) Transcript_100:184-450(-)